MNWSPLYTVHYWPQSNTIYSVILSIVVGPYLYPGGIGSCKGVLNTGQNNDQVLVLILMTISKHSGQVNVAHSFSETQLWVNEGFWDTKKRKEKRSVHLHSLVSFKHMDLEYSPAENACWMSDSLPLSSLTLVRYLDAVFCWKISCQTLVYYNPKGPCEKTPLHPYSWLWWTLRTYFKDM